MEPYQNCSAEDSFTDNGMGLNPCVPHETSGFCTELYKNYLWGECI